MIGTLFKRNMLSCVKVFFILFSVLCLYTTVIIYMYNPELSDMLSGYQEVLPQMMAAVGMTGVASNLLEWIQIYLYGFIMNVFPLIFIIIIGNRLMMNYIDKGSMASLLSTPHSRLRIVLTQAVSMILLVILLIASTTAVGIISCRMMFPGELNVSRYLMLNGSMVLLQLVVAGIVFLAACMGSEAKQYYLYGAGIPLLFYMIQMMANMGGNLEKLKYATIYTLFPAEKIIQATDGYIACHVAMVAITILLFGSGIWWFCRRDFSV